MLKKLSISILVVTLGVSVTGYAQEKDPKMQKEVDALKQKLGDGWIIQWNKEGTALNHIEQGSPYEVQRNTGHRSHEYPDSASSIRATRYPPGDLPEILDL